MPNVVKQINHFFAKHGSPMAGYGKAFVHWGRQFGVDPRYLAAIAMKETEGGLTGTGRASSGYGAFGVGPRRQYPGYKAAIKDAAHVLSSPTYRGKNLAQQTAMWVSGGPPSSSTMGYTQDIKQMLGMLGAGPQVAGGYQAPRVPRQRRTPSAPGLPGVPGIQGTTLPNPTPMLQSLGDIVGVPWTLQLPDIHLPSIPGQPPVKGKKGKVIPVMPGQPQQIYRLLQAAQTATKLSPGYSKATARGPLKNVSYKSALDCSLSVAKVLQAAGLGFGPNQSAPVSGWMAKNWGKPGKGKYLTMYANDGHVFLEFKIGKKFYRFDTSAWGAKDQRSGPRLRNTQRSTEGFVARHWPGL